MTLSDLEKRDTRGLIFQADLRIYARSIGPITTRFGMVTHVGMSVFYGVSNAIAYCIMRRAVCQRQLSFLSVIFLHCRQTRLMSVAQSTFSILIS